jgi:hypothetical protein
MKSMKSIKVNGRVFPADALSTLLSCIAFISLTHELNTPKCGYQLYGTQRKISNFL